MAGRGEEVTASSGSGPSSGLPQAPSWGCRAAPDRSHRCSVTLHFPRERSFHTSPPVLPPAEDLGWLLGRWPRLDRTAARWAPRKCPVSLAEPPD